MYLTGNDKTDFFFFFFDKTDMNHSKSFTTWIQEG